jgi:hypothetical protein
MPRKRIFRYKLRGAGTEFGQQILAMTFTPEYVAKE